MAFSVIVKTNTPTPELFRVIDANLNRLKEGIRVIEDVARYIHNNKELASDLKNLRHTCRINALEQLLTSRDSVNDVLRPTVSTELEREDIRGIVLANYKRAQESARVLEEMCKVIDPALSETFKSVRYRLYTLEKQDILEQSL